MCQIQAHREKAPVVWNTAKRFVLKLIAGLRASVLECGGPPPLSAPGLMLPALTEIVIFLINTITTVRSILWYLYILYLTCPRVIARVPPC